MTAPRIRLGVIRNPVSSRNRREPRGYGAPLSVPANVELLIAEPATHETLDQVLQGFAQCGVNHLVIDGGDGTVRDVMTLLPAYYPNRLPRISIIPGGNANLAAADVGSHLHGRKALSALLTSLAVPGGGRIERRTMLATHRPDGSQPPIYSFFAGAAALRRGWELATGSVLDRGLMHGPAVAVTMLGAVWQTLFGGHGNAWQAGTPMAIRVDDGDWQDGSRFIFLATGLTRLYRFWPFFDHGDAPLRWLDIDAHPPKLARALPSLVSGNPKPWIRDSGAYRSGGARQRIVLKMAEPLIVDGEAQHPDRDGLLELRPGPEIECYLPLKSS